jgi:hypothetical protein
MTILVSPSQRASAASREIPAQSASDGAWRLLGWLGAALLLMGGADVLLAWYPAAFGRIEWEFAAISTTLNGLALPILGLSFILTSAFARNRRIAVRVAGTMMLVAAAALMILAVIYATAIPVAFQAVAQNADLAIGIKKGVAKAIMLFVVYLTLLTASGVFAWRGTRQLA